MPRLLSYVVRHDYGFAPNPYGGFLTLATCKSPVRDAARLGDIVIGTGSVGNVGSGRLIFAGRVSEIVPTDRYGAEERFAIKRPSKEAPSWRRRGDNIYERVDGQWTQRPNPFHDEGNVAIDLKSLRVLVCEQFWYFGDAAPDISADFGDVLIKRHFKYTTDPQRIAEFETFLARYEPGIHGRPSRGGGLSLP